jgi:hypothetical protein
MTALQPTLIAYSPEGSRQQFTPPPQHILPAAAIEAVQVRLPCVHLVLLLCMLWVCLMHACIAEHAAWLLLIQLSFMRAA